MLFFFAFKTQWRKCRFYVWFLIYWFRTSWEVFQTVWRKQKHYVIMFFIILFLSILILMSFWLSTWLYIQDYVLKSARDSTKAIHGLSSLMNEPRLSSWLFLYLNKQIWMTWKEPNSNGCLQVAHSFVALIRLKLFSIHSVISGISSSLDLDNIGSINFFTSASNNLHGISTNHLNN